MALQAARAELLLQTLLRLRAQAQLATDRVFVLLGGVAAGERGKAGKLGDGIIFGESGRRLAAVDFGRDSGVRAAQRTYTSR